MSFPVERPLTYLITPGGLDTINFETDAIKLVEKIADAALAGISIVQIREKQITARKLFELVSRAVAVTAGTATKLLVNERLDIAMAAKADGVHLTARSFSPAAIKDLVPEGTIIGVSTHSIDEIGKARDSGGDYVLFGPVFKTPGKSRPAGLEILRQACAEFGGFPIIGLGGIDETNKGDVIAAGAAGFASIRYLNTIIGGESPKM